MSTSLRSVDMIFLGLTIHYVYLLPFDICIMLFILRHFYVTHFHTYTHTHKHTHTHTHIHSRIHIHSMTHTHTYDHIQIFSHTFTHTHTHTITRTFPYTHSYTLPNTRTKRALQLIMAKGETSNALQICIKMLTLDTYKRLLTQAHSHTSCSSIATLSLK